MAKMKRLESLTMRTKKSNDEALDVARQSEAARAGTLSDDDAWRQGFMKITSVAVEEGGQAVVFTYSNGARYKVPADYVASWFSVSSEGAVVPRLTGSKVLSGSLEDKEGYCARVLFENGAVHLVGWDLILMACEPRYVHFGGFTEHSQRLTALWWRDQDNDVELNSGAEVPGD
jgi:hypothetical protein